MLSVWLRIKCPAVIPLSADTEYRSSEVCSLTLLKGLIMAQCAALARPSRKKQASLRDFFNNIDRKMATTGRMEITLREKGEITPEALKDYLHAKGYGYRKDGGHFLIVNCDKVSIRVNPPA